SSWPASSARPASHPRRDRNRCCWRSPPRALASPPMVYDEEAYQYQSPPKSPIPAAVLTSIITTVAVFFGLRLLDDRGLFGHGKQAGEAIEVPSLLGIRPEQARELLRGRGLLLTLSGEPEASKYPAGT